MANRAPSPADAKTFFTEEEFLALVAASDDRLEYWDGTIIDMAESEPAHSLIQDNLFAALSKRLSAPGKARGAENTIKSDLMETYRYADLSVVCGEAAYRDTLLPNGKTVKSITNPVVIVEVISKTSRGRDQVKKRREYRAIDVLQEYLIIDQYQARITRDVKNGSFWQTFESEGLNETLAMASLKIEIPFSEIYDGVTFSDEAA
ncbi:MAG TPA: Uma2 family endonuclease [Blastocatellia bacterium]|nr:Uma2 family endonuclease [Blastocatellia bacterium]